MKKNTVKHYCTNSDGTDGRDALSQAVFQHCDYNGIIIVKDNLMSNNCVYCAEQRQLQHFRTTEPAQGNKCLLTDVGCQHHTARRKRTAPPGGLHTDGQLVTMCCGRHLPVCCGLAARQ